MLFGISAHDPLTVAGVVSLLTFVAFAACYIPARRATRGRSDGRAEKRLTQGSPVR